MDECQLLLEQIFIKTTEETHTFNSKEDKFFKETADRIAATHRNSRKKVGMRLITGE